MKHNLIFLALSISFSTHFIQAGYFEQEFEYPSSVKKTITMWDICSRVYGPELVGTGYNAPLPQEYSEEELLSPIDTYQDDVHQLNEYQQPYEDNVNQLSEPLQPYEDNGYKPSEPLQPEEESFTCSICNKIFTKKYLLTAHKKEVHFIKQPFACQEPDCGKTFKNETALILHEKRHRGERSFICPIAHCKKSFLFERALEKHLNIHATKETFSCPYCSYKNKRHDRVVKHMAALHPEELLPISTNQTLHLKNPSELLPQLS